MKRLENQPTLQTERLRMRALRIDDAIRVQELAGDRRVAEMTTRIPHPYPAGAAEEWITAQAGGWEYVFAITRKEEDELIGVIGVHPEASGLMAEIGFWIGVRYWGRGYCSEAAREVLRFCFEDLGIQRVHAGHFPENVASGRVQEKIGMRWEGVQRWGACRFGELKDLVLRGITQPDWMTLRRDHS